MISFSPFYTDESWEPVEALLIEQGITPTAEDRAGLDYTAAIYKWRRDFADPTNNRMSAARACLRTVRDNLGKVCQAVDQLQRMEIDEFEISQIFNGLEDWQRQARLLKDAAAAIEPKHGIWNKANNRSRPRCLNLYFGSLVHFWRIRSGRPPGKSPTSPAVKFILAAAEPVEPNLKADAVTYYIRTRWTKKQLEPM
jgi:hypothetical protein